jgi:hypothetical protein
MSGPPGEALRAIFGEMDRQSRDARESFAQAGAVAAEAAASMRQTGSEDNHSEQPQESSPASCQHLCLPMRVTSREHHGAQFTLKHIAKEKIFGTKPVWRGRSRIAVSDVHRTIVDMLDDPPLGGGIQHVADCLTAYLRRSDRHDAKLIEYGERLGNGAVFKRLGFLAARTAGGESLVAASQTHLTTRPS